MRPDQHKKKKNAEYKKKHGIQGKEKGKNVDKTQQNNATEMAATSRRSDSDNSQSEGEAENVNVQKNFSRRKIESNWDRYKDDELETGGQSFDAVPITCTHKIGTDFQVLLDKTGGPSSHFLFKNEKDWESINDKIDATPLSIDLESLAEALRNIPLEKRLEIDKKYFMDDQPNKDLSSPHGHQEIQKKTETIQTFSKVLKPDNFKPPKQNSTAPHPDLVTENQGIPEDKNNMQNVQTASSEISLEKDGNDLEGFLDTETIATESQKSVNTNHDEKQNVLVTSANGKSDEPAKVPKSQADTKEDLEDWLDSILD